MFFIWQDQQNFQDIFTGLPEKSLKIPTAY